MQAWTVGLEKLFWRFNSSPRLRICQFSCELCHVPHQIYSSHIYFPAFVWTGFLGSKLLRKAMMVCSAFNVLIMIFYFCFLAGKIFIFFFPSFLFANCEYSKALARCLELCTLFCCRYLSWKYLKERLAMVQTLTLLQKSHSKASWLI